MFRPIKNEKGEPMKNIINKVKSLWKDESGQGAVEYILLLVVVVAIAMLFKNQITEAVSGKISELGSQIGSFK